MVWATGIVDSKLILAAGVAENLLNAGVQNESVLYFICSLELKYLLLAFSFGK